MIASGPAADRDQILAGLESPDEESRRLCVEQLSELPIEEALPLLSRRLGDDVWRVRKAAVERLTCFLDHPSVQELLIDSLSDGEDPGRRNSAFEALVACGSRVTARLVAELSSPDVDVRKLVIDALAAIGDPAARGSLVAATFDPDTNVRAAAVEALGVVGGRAEIAHLVRAAAGVHEDVLVRLSALRSLSRLEANIPVAELSQALEESVLHASVYALLGHSDDPSTPHVLIKGLSEKNRSSREAAMASLLRRLSEIDGAQVQELRSDIREASKSNDILIESACERVECCDLAERFVLVQFLGLLGNRRVVVSILRAGRDEAVEEVCRTTLESMGEGVTRELAARWDELDNDLRIRSLPVLARIGGDQADAILGASLEAPDSEVRCAAMAAFGQSAFLHRLPELARRLDTTARSDEPDAAEEISVLMGAICEMAERSESVAAGLDIRVIEVLVSRLAGAPSSVRLAIAQVLSRLGRPEDEDVIGYLLKDESSSVRRAAVQTLARFPFSKVSESLRLALGDESTAVRTAAAGALGRFDDPAAMDELEGRLKDTSPNVIAVALRSIGRLASRLEVARPRALELLDVGIDAPPIVALASIEALSEVGGERAGTLAAQALDRSEPEVIRAAIACIDAHGDAAALASLIPVTAHTEWSVRAEAARVLSNRSHRTALPALLRRVDLEEDTFVREVILSAIRKLEG